MSNLPDLFETPIRVKKLSEHVTAYQYRNGVINIDGQKFIGYSLTEAIKKFKSNQKQK